MIVKTFKIPIYFGELHVFIDDDFKAVNDKFDLGISDRFVNGNCDGVSGRFTRKNSHISKYFIILNTKPTHKIIGHESVHLVNFLFYDRQIELDLTNDEPQAYLVGWFIEKITNACKNYLK
jgi:hypothetical protein